MNSKLIQYSLPIAATILVAISIIFIVHPVNAVSYTVPSNMVMINADDGTPGQALYMKPVLDQFGYKSTFFVICGKVGTKGYMTWDQVHSLQSDGMDIQAHTMTHPDLTKLSAAQLRYELQTPFNCFKGNGTTGVHVMADPHTNGAFNTTVIAAQMQAGYDLVRGSTSHYQSLTCNSNNCLPFINNGTKQNDNFFNLEYWSSLGNDQKYNYNQTQSMQGFISEVTAKRCSTCLPILVYHVLTNNTTLSSAGMPMIYFKQQMQWLHDHNYIVIDMNGIGIDYTNNWLYLK